jgi:hypothetical protein
MKTPAADGVRKTGCNEKQRQSHHNFTRKSARSKRFPTLRHARRLDLNLRHHHDLSVPWCVARLLQKRRRRLFQHAYACGQRSAHELRARPSAELFRIKDTLADDQFSAAWSCP